ncbi:hypothetical protein BKA82DRAFT_13716 [Pisolithus tinctorius]|uniref:Phosphatidylglycerol lysyltransferase C-terminal domain-containing protein n=1 Tax=Pisolithus tinctorius Marx 270 TaxID=870435 RepID=A0A0C3JMT0_PISTI|nr:hypothetical protein BKA82DRAFT_13716 [Pisolithus tinctorius]KIO10498.1 hypothetical protein M404DRAFT_13716 [Pisolithus tinctorius Marx 270]
MKAFSRIFKNSRKDALRSQECESERTNTVNKSENNSGCTREHSSPDPVSGTPIDSAELADIIAKHGHAPATAWLERERYHVWRPSSPQSSAGSFLPIQGYLCADGWVFAWGSPIVPEKKEDEIRRVAIAFVEWVQSHHLRPVYCCVDAELEDILGNMGWSTVHCINEDVIDAEHVLELTSEDDKGGHGPMVKDLKKNLRRAARAKIEVVRINREEWTQELREEVEAGIEEWKKNRKGLQLAATSFDPWLDFENRLYWVAKKGEKLVGILILTPAGDSYVIKNCVSFPDAPKGTSERLIHDGLQDLDNKREQGGSMSVTFNISAAGDLEPTRNISGWKFTWLSQTYRNVSKGANLLQRSDFRRKFDASKEPMFVCYLTEDGFGWDGIETLLRLLRR